MRMNLILGIWFGASMVSFPPPHFINSYWKFIIMVAFLPRFRFAVSTIILTVLLADVCNAQLVDPIAVVNSSTPLAVGVASYGLYNISSGSGPYQVQTSEVIGYSRIDSMSAYNATPPANTSQNGATIQLNVVMNVTGDDGHLYSYWLQDALDLNTSNKTYFLGDNIWNLTSSFANVTNATISGNGNFTNSSYPISAFVNGSEELYGYFLNNTQYSYPLQFSPVIRVEMQDGHPAAEIGYDQNGTYYFYDNVTFNIPARNAYILITPYYMTPTPRAYYDRSYYYVNGSYYDAEMVIGGEGNGEISQFNNTQATLWIGYLNNSVIEPFPIVADFGLDTGESAANLTSGQENGNAAVTEGTLNYGESIRLYGVPGALLKSTISSTTVATTAPVATASVTATSAPPATTTLASNRSVSVHSNASAPPGSSSPSVPLAIYAILAIVIVIVAIAFYFIIRLMRGANRQS